MNSGIIASRYAVALLKFTTESGNGDVVARQIRSLLVSLAEVADLRRVADDMVVVSLEEKMSLFKAALGSEKMAPELERFLELLIRNGRIDSVSFIFHSYLKKYSDFSKVKHGHLKTAVASVELEEKLKKLIEDHTGCKLLLETEIAPSLLGGFVFEFDDWMLDASVARQLEIIRSRFVENNRRIV